MNWPGRNASRLSGSSRRERVSGACVTTSTTRAVCSTAMAPGLDVHRVARNDDLDLRVGVGHDRLAPEPGRRRETDRFVQEVLLGFLGRAELLGPLLHDDVTRGAGAYAAARVLEVGAVAEEDVEDRGRLAVVLERRCAGIELDHAFGVA